MKNNWTLIRNVPLALALVLSLAACEREGPAEQAGEQIDQSVEQATEQAEGAAEQAGEAAEEAGEKIEHSTGY
jgi:predicted small lipoprotein YifL